jgi:hypothetical protein
LGNERDNGEEYHDERKIVPPITASDAQARIGLLVVEVTLIPAAITLLALVTPAAMPGTMRRRAWARRAWWDLLLRETYA